MNETAASTSGDIAVTDPATYRHWVEDVVRYSDTDASGHVNNVAYAAFVESGRVTFARNSGIDRSAGEGWILGRLAIDYRAEAFFPGRVRIGSRVAKLGNKSFTLASAVFMDERCLATAVSVLVFRRNGAAEPIPAHIRAQLQADLAD